MAALKKRIQHENPHVVNYSLLVLESAVKNCSSPVHVEVFAKDFLEALKLLVKVCLLGRFILVMLMLAFYITCLLLSFFPCLLLPFFSTELPLNCGYTMVSFSRA